MTVGGLFKGLYLLLRGVIEFGLLAIVVGIMIGIILGSVQLGIMLMTGLLK